MNNKLYKWLAVTLLLSVSIFCFLYLTKTEKNKDGQASAIVGNTDNAEIIEIPKEPPVKPVFYNTLPRAAAETEGYMVQHIGGSGADTLKSVHTVDKNTVVFFDTASNGYDVKTEKPSVAAALLDEKLSLKKTVTLTGQSPEKFSAVKQTASGFFVVTCSEEYAAVYRLDFELLCVNKTVIEKANGFSLYSANDKIYLIAEKTDSLQIKVLTRELDIIKSATVYLDSARVKSVFPSGDTLNIFANTAGGYTLLRYTEDGGICSVTEVNDYTLLSVLPYSDEGILKFVGLRKSGESISIFCANADFGIINEKVTDYGDFADLFIANGNFSVYGTKNKAASVSVYCKHLDKVLEKDAPPYERFCYRNYNQDDITVAGFIDNTLSVCSFNGLDFVQIFQFNGANDYCTLLFDGTYAFSTAHKSGIFKNNYGNYDIYIIKKLG